MTVPDIVDRGPHPVDLHVGAQVRTRRKALNISQEGLAEELALPFQQVQKYERGANRVSASKLYQLAGVLEVGVAFFFEGLPDPAVAYRLARRSAAEPRNRTASGRS